MLDYKIDVPEYSDWKCYLFGSTDVTGITYIPPKGKVPNWFVCWMMKICLGYTWIKEKKV